MSDEQIKEPGEVVNEQISLGSKIYNMPSHKLFISSFTAGLEISFSLVLMGLLYTMFEGQLSKSALSLVISLGYPIGFIFVIMGRSELFTEQTALAMVPVLNKDQSLKSLVRLWMVVLLGNLIGGLLFSLFISWFGPAKGIVSAEALEHIAQKFIDQPLVLVLGSALLAGWMMGLLGWLLTSARESIARIMLIILVTIIIGFANLHHCVVGSVEVLSALWLEESVSWSDYLQFLWPSVVGNILGGALFVSVLKFALTKE